MGESKPLQSVAAILTLAALLLATPAVGQSIDPYASDPVDLIALREETQTYSSGVDTWEVWICQVPNGTVPLTAAGVVATLEGGVRPYFESISGGNYATSFRTGGVVTASSPSSWPDNPFIYQTECEDLAAAAANPGAAGVIVVVNVDYSGGYATGGLPCLPGFLCSETFPANGRIAVVGAATVAVIGGFPPALRTIAHEIGHTVFWPHSYGGLLDFENGVVYEYDNPMDVMSGGDHETLDIGTIAINRYAAGWIGPDNVIFHRGGTLTYQIGSSSGVQILVLPTEVTGIYETVGVRFASGYDSGLPAEGVEVYRVDQSAAVCDFVIAGQCSGPDRRISQVPALEDPAATAHVYPEGATFVVRGVTITVGTRFGNAFNLLVSGAAVAERFIDENGNPHESNIEFIAEHGITRGCNPPVVDRFCPAGIVTRAEMAAFLLSAIGQSPATSYQGTFSDVPAGLWYTPYVEALAALGYTTGLGDGTYAPNQAVSRAEMAAFLARVFALAPASSSGFSDVAAGEWYASAVDSIRAVGITSGCTPSTYCPHDAVLREQMATFLARALG
ncbi:MAG: S-layer homology domain-containing protein [Acidimicrobiia bacterium]